MIEQLTVFLENEKGRLAAVCRAIAQANINLHALNLADTTEFGVVRMLCDTPRRAAEILKAQGWQAAVTPVLAIEIPNEPGGLAHLLEFLDAENVNVEYGYCFSVNNQMAIDVLKVNDESIEKKLLDRGFKSVRPKDVYHAG